MLIKHQRFPQITVLQHPNPVLKFHDSDYAIQFNWTKYIVILTGFLQIKTTLISSILKCALYI